MLERHYTSDAVADAHVLRTRPQLIERDVVADENVNLSLRVVEHPQHRQHTQGEWNTWYEATERQRTHRARRFVRRRVNNDVKVSSGSDMAVQDDGDAADHGIANVILFEPIKEITVSLWSYTASNQQDVLRNLTNALLASECNYMKKLTTAFTARP